MAHITGLFIKECKPYCISGFYQFIRPHHKKRFDEKCVELTGQGCDYKPDHSLSKEEKETLMQNGGMQSILSF